MNTVDAAKFRDEFNHDFPGMNDLIHRDHMHPCKERGEVVTLNVAEREILRAASGDPRFDEFLRAHEASTCGNSSGVTIIFDRATKTLTFSPPPRKVLIPGAEE